MKNKLLHLSAILFLTIGITLTSCTPSAPSTSTPPHEHTFSDIYVYDDTYHWHPAICGHDVQGDKEEHTFTKEVIKPTYESGGYTTYTCSVCGYSYTDDEIDALPITITWKNYDGTILEVDNNVPYGSMPSYNGATPIKESDSSNDYYFAGWTPEVVRATESTTYTATFSSEEITYTIDFDLNGGTSNSYRGPIEIKTLSKDVFFFDCVKEGWSFRGWEYQNEKIFDEKGNQLKNVTLVDNMVFKAIYTQTVKLTIVSNIPEAGTITGEGEYPYNTYVDVSATPNQGYRFIGWYYQGTLLSNTEDYKYMMWNQDITLEARFESDYFTMRVYSNSEEHGLVLLRSDSNLDYLSEYEEQRKYASDVTIEAQSKTDVRFLGWYDENNQLVTTNAVYSFVMPNHDYTLEAKWNYFEITYNLNGGVNNENNPTSYSIDDDNITLNAPTKEGYEFVGWKYNDEFVDEIDTNTIDDITLEAVWISYEYTIEEDSNGNKYAIITDFDDSIEEVYIPSEVVVDSESIPVKEIGSGAFEDNTTIISIIIPDSVTTIGSNAFDGCSNLATVTFGENSQLTTIGYRAFYSCSSLTSIIIPDSVTSIGNYAFGNCDSLTSIIIPDSVTSIGSNAFDGCSNLIIYCEAASEPDGWASDWNYNWNPSNCPVVWVGGDFIIDGDYAYVVHTDDKGRYIEIVRYIGSEEEVVIPNTINVNGEDILVTSIGSYAFYGCSSLTSIIIPNSVTTISFSAFKDCTNLTTVTFGDNSQLTSIGSYAFAYCDNLTTVTFGDNSQLTSIGNSAFYGCDNLTTVTFGEDSQLTTIGDSAFWICSSLTSIIIPDSVTTIGDYAFEYCSNLTIYCEATSKPSGWSSSWNSSNCPVVWVGGDIIIIGDYAYVARTDGEERYIEIVTYLGNETKVIIPDTISIGGEDTSVTSIGDYAFYNCDSLTSIIIPDGVTTIGDYAFSNCSSLTSIIIPDGVTTIGDYAFYDCDNLTTVTFGENSQLTSIGEYAFSYCSSLTSIIIPNSVTTIGSYAFSNCYNLTTVTFGENSQLTKIDDYVFYNCDSLTSIAIPGGVTTIGSYAFSGCSNLATVTIGENSQLTSIGNYAFQNCSSLTSIIIPNSVTTIGSNAFNNCDLLTSIIIPDSVTTIGSSAFYDCDSLTSIIIPNSVTKIDSYAFEDCTNLIIYCEAESEPDGWKSNWNSSNRPVVWVDGNIIIDGDFAYVVHADGEERYVEIVRYIGSEKEVVIPDTINVGGEDIPVTTIGDYAFYDCSSLTSIIIPNSVTTIGYRAFSSCSNLVIYCEAASQPSGWNSDWNYSDCPVVWVGEDIVVDGDYAYVVRIDGEEQYVEIVTYLGDETKVVIPNTININGEDILVTTIGDNAFYNNDTITSVKIGDNVTSIDSRAFYDCDSLTSIIIPDSVTSIDEYAFRDCYNLIIYCEATSKPSGWNSDWNSSDCTVVWVGGDIIVDEDYSYVVRTDGEEQYVEIVTYLGDETKVVIPDTISVDSVNMPVTTIGDYAFSNNDTITSVTIGDNVTSIDSCAFYNCDSLISIIIPDSVTTIGSSAFRDCFNLTTVTFGDNSQLTSIGQYAFSSCSNLTTVTFGENSQLTTIGSYAFYGCDSLTSIIIPNSVTTISFSAFEDCTNLTTVTFGENSQLTTIGDYAFYNCSSLTSIIIPDSVASIGSRAFYNCDSLTSIIIPYSVTSIGDYAFYSCNNLTTVTFIDNSQLTSIGNYTFAYSDNLTTITFGENSQLSTIGSSAFYGCDSLASIIIPDSVASIDHSAFEDCDNLTIYCEAASQPSGWASNWNYSDCQVVWGYTGVNGEYNGFEYVVSVDSEGNKYITIIVYNGTYTNVVIPDTISVDGNEIHVTTIGDNAFNNNDTIISVTIGYNVTTVGNHAFDGCSNLTTVTFGENSQLTTIGDYAFYYCSSLTSIIIPDSVASIGSRAFYNCDSLTSIIIPESVISIGSYTFYYCYSLTIYCEATSKPSGWASYWKDSSCSVVWGSRDK